MRTTCLAACAAALLLGAGSTPGAAQSLAQRIEGGPDGTVRLSFAARPGVHSDHGGYRLERTPGEWEGDEPDGPVRVALDVAAHHVTAIRLHVGGHWLPGPAGTRDLGNVAAPDAADYLLDLAGHATGEVAHKAIVPAVLADSAVVWPRLLALARDASRPEGLRRDATFWLSQQAAQAATKGLADLAENDGDRQVRRAAVFALSQRPAGEGLPVLMRLARTSHDPEVRRQAIFWIGQSHDARALDFLREILSGG